MPAKTFLTSNRDWMRDIFILSLFLVIFYTLWLGSHALFSPDESRYSEVAREMVASSDYITPRVDGVAFLDKPVLYYWLQAAAILLFGVKEWSLRLFPALFGVFGSLMTYICGRRLFDRRTGLLSAIILATTPLYFGCAHYANLDLEVAVLISGTLLCLVTGFQAEGSAQKAWLTASYAFAALAFLTKGMIGIAFPVMITGCWILLLWQWDVLLKARLISGLTLFSILVLPWYYLVQRANPEFLHFFFVTQQVTRFLSGASFNNASPFWFYLPIALAGFFPWTAFLFHALARHIANVCRAGREHRTELYLLLWAAIIFVFFSIPKSKMISYILPVFPPLSLLVGSYLSSIWDNTRVNILYPVVAILSALILITLALLLASLHFGILDYPPAFLPFLYGIMVILVLFGISAIYLARKARLPALFSACTMSSAAILLALSLSASHLNQNTAKPLTTLLLPRLLPQDEVVNYFKFYQDVPLYLGRRISIVANWSSPDIQLKDNWLRELWYGMAFQKTDDWLINENTFWQRWNGGRRLFVFLNVNYLANFKKHAGQYYILGQHNDILLLSNKLT